MRKIEAKQITKTIKELCMQAAYDLPTDVFTALQKRSKEEPYPLAEKTLGVILDNAIVATTNKMPICQDTGMAFIYIMIGQEVYIEGNLEEAIQRGVSQGYQEGYLRKSIVDDPLYDRINTQDNTPAIIHYEIVAGDVLHVVVAPKGFGSENMSQIKMLKPSDGEQGVKDFILQVVSGAGPNACPPMVIGVGIGGSFEKAPMLAKKALLKEIDSHHSDSRYASLEKELLTMINDTGIGPAGYGGKTTALALHIETQPTHLAGLPVAVSICCHVARHKEATL